MLFKIVKKSEVAKMVRVSEDEEQGGCSEEEDDKEEEESVDEEEERCTMTRADVLALNKSSRATQKFRDCK